MVTVQKPEIELCTRYMRKLNALGESLALRHSSTFAAFPHVRSNALEIGVVW